MEKTVHTILCFPEITLFVSEFNPLCNISLRHIVLLHSELKENYWSNFTKSNEEQISLPAYLTFILSKENMVMGRDKTKIRVLFDAFLESISQSLNEKWGGIEEKSCLLGVF